jgi:ATP-dependent protease HslVU (ClpYQ) ATPase subunit
MDRAKKFEDLGFLGAAVEQLVREVMEQAAAMKLSAEAERAYEIAQGYVLAQLRLSLARADREVDAEIAIAERTLPAGVVDLAAWRARKAEGGCR